MTMTVEVSVIVDDERREEIDEDVQTEKGYAEYQARKHVSDEFNNPRGHRATTVTNVEEIGGDSNKVAYDCLVHFKGGY